MIRSKSGAAAMGLLVCWTLVLFGTPGAAGETGARAADARPPAPQEPVGGQPDRRQPVSFLKTDGQPLLEVDWSKTGAPYTLLLIGVASHEESYGLDEVAMSANLSEWSDLTPGLLRAVEVWVVGDVASESKHAFGPWHDRLQVRESPNEALLRTLCPDSDGRILVVTSNGRTVFQGRASSAGAWTRAEAYVDDLRERWVGPTLPGLLEELAGCDTSWRLAVDLVVSWRRTATLDELWPAIEPLTDVSRGRDESRATSAVQLGALLLLASQATGNPSAKQMRELARCALVKGDATAELALGWFEASRAEAPVKELKQLVPRGKSGGDEAVVAARRLRLRSDTIERELLERLAELNPRQWESRAQILRYLAELREPGFSIPGDEPTFQALVPQPPGIADESTWQVRLAYAEALPSYPRPDAVFELVRLVEMEGNPRVLDAALDSLFQLTGMRLGARRDRWVEWVGQQGADWRPSAPEIRPWLPPLDVDEVGFSSSDGGLFRTDLAQVLFVIDTSESMRDGLEREVRKGLERQFDLFGADTRIGLVVFAERAVHRETKPALRQATERTKEDYLRYYDELVKAGRTDLEAGLRAAFEVPDVQEMFIVTDGLATEGERTSTPDLIELCDQLNLHRRVRISTLLLRVGREYFEEDLKGGDLPEPTIAEREIWANKFEMDQLTEDDLSLLFALAKYHGGESRIAFGTQLYSRFGPPAEDQ